MDIGLIDVLLTPRASLQELANIETAILKVATLINCPVTGESYERLQTACRVVTAHYLYPSAGIEQLYVDLAIDQSTDLAQAFYREYGKEEQEHEQ